MNVLSLFDGMSCGQLALNHLGIKVDKYYASEIDKYAIKVTQANFPDTIQVGDICNLDPKDFMDVSLIIAGSPCQGFSFAGHQLAFDDPRSALFFEFIRLLKEIKPKYFLLENVKMKKEFLNVITEQVSACYPDYQQHYQNYDLFGGKIDPILINSALLSAQNRERYYWTNIPNVTQPKDRGIVLSDILERANSGGGSIPSIKLKDEFNKNLDKMTTKQGKAFALTASYNGAVAWNSIEKKQRTMVPADVDHKYYLSDKAIDYMNRSNKKYTGKKTRAEHYIKHENEKSKTLTANMNKGVPYGVIAVDKPKIKETNQEVYWRKLTCVEAERLQTVPDNYTNHVSNSQRYKMLGNSFTVFIISHILRGIKDA